MKTKKDVLADSLIALSGWYKARIDKLAGKKTAQLQALLEQDLARAAKTTIENFFANDLKIKTGKILADKIDAQAKKLSEASFAPFKSAEFALEVQKIVSKI